VEDEGGGWRAEEGGEKEEKEEKSNIRNPTTNVLYHVEIRMDMRRHTVLIIYVI
jgi:hypothetical protein